MDILKASELANDISLILLKHPDVSEEDWELIWITAKGIRNANLKEDQRPLPFEKVNIFGIAHDLMDRGKIVEGYTLVLLQQIRDKLREINGS